jgi:hypothetical protein
VARRALIHENAQFAGEVRLTKRPEWVRPAIASPRHSFSWFVWSSEPRAPAQGPFLRLLSTHRLTYALVPKWLGRREATSSRGLIGKMWADAWGHT